MFPRASWCCLQLEPSGSGGGGSKKTLNGAVQFFKDLGHSATNLVHRRSDDEEEDPEYLKARAERVVGGLGVL